MRPCASDVEEKRCFERSGLESGCGYECEYEYGYEEMNGMWKKEIFLYEMRMVRVEDEDEDAMTAMSGV